MTTKKPPRTLIMGKVQDKAKEATAFAKAASDRTGPTKSFHAPEGYRRLTINLPNDLHLALKRAALDSDTTATALIEELLREKLNMPA